MGFNKPAESKFLEQVGLIYYYPTINTEIVY